MGQDIGIHEPLPAGRRLSTGRRAWFNTRQRIAIGFRRHGGVAWRAISAPLALLIRAERRWKPDVSLGGSP
jgi:hypothetical protein